MQRLHKIVLLVSIIFFPFFITDRVLAEIYWVSNNGTQTNINNCKGSIPLLGVSCCTPATLFNSTSLTGGDIVYFRGGDGGLYTSSAGNEYGKPAYYPHSSGTSWDNPLVFKAYNNEKVVFRMGNRYPILGIRDTDYVTLDGFTVWMDSSFGNVSFGPFVTYSSSNKRLKGIRILNMIFEGDTGYNGDLKVLAHLTDLEGFLVSNCLFRNNVGTGGDLGNVVGLDTYNTRDSTSPAIEAVIEKSTFYNITGAAINFKSGGKSENQCFNLIIRQNLFYDVGINTPNPAVSIGYDSTGAQIYQNLFIDSGVSRSDAIGTDNTKIYNNTFIGHMDVNFGGTANTNISNYYNNGFVNNEWYNNIFRLKTANNYVIDVMGLGNTPSYCNHNGYYGYPPRFRLGSDTYNNLSAWQAAGWDTNSFTADPLFVNYTGDETGDYRLQSDSPYRNAGRNGITLGAYIMGNEQIGYSREEHPDTTPPAPPTGVTIS